MQTARDMTSDEFYVIKVIYTTFSMLMWLAAWQSQSFSWNTVLVQTEISHQLLDGFHGPQRMNPDDFAHPLTVPLAPPVTFCLFCEISRHLKNWLNIHGFQMMFLVIPRHLMFSMTFLN